MSGGFGGTGFDWRSTCRLSVAASRANCSNVSSGAADSTWQQESQRATCSSSAAICSVPRRPWAKSWSCCRDGCSFCPSLMASLMGTVWRLRREPFRSIDQFRGFLPEPSQHARSGDKDRVGSQPQFRGDIAGRSPFQGGPLEGLPGAGLELATEHVQELTGDVPIMLEVPMPAELALRIGTCRQELAKAPLPPGL